MRYTKNASSQEKRDKRFRFSIRKFNVGVASVAVAAFWMVSGGTVAANETSVSEATAVVATAPAALGNATELAIASEVAQPTEEEQSATEVQAQPTTEATTAIELTEVAPQVEVPVTEAPATQVAPSVPAGPTRTAATTYRVQYVDESTGEVLKSQNYSVSEQTTTPANAPHFFSVTINLEAPKGYTSLAAQNDAGEEFSLYGNALAAAVVEKDAASRLLMVTVRKDDAISGDGSQQDYSDFRATTGSSSVPAINAAWTVSELYPAGDALSAGREAYAKATTTITGKDGETVTVTATFEAVNPNYAGIGHFAKGTSNQSSYGGESQHFEKMADPAAVPALDIYVQATPKTAAQTEVENLNFHGSEESAIMTLTFSKEVTDPIIDLSGIGGSGTANIPYPVGHPKAGQAMAVLGSFNSTDLEFLTEHQGLSLSAGSDNLQIVDNNKVTVIDRNTRARVVAEADRANLTSSNGAVVGPIAGSAGTGSVQVKGTFTELKIKMYHASTPFSAFKDPKYNTPDIVFLSGTTIDGVELVRPLDGINGLDNNNVHTPAFGAKSNPRNLTNNNQDLFRFSIRLLNETKGNVVINYVDLDGNVIANPKQDVTDQAVDTAYNTTEEGEKPAVLTADQTRDGKVYFLTEKTAMTDGSAIAEGVKQTESTTGEGAATVKHTAVTSGDTAKVVEGTTHVTYVYEQAGDVKVNYFKVGEDGQPTTDTLSGTATGIAKANVAATEVDTVLGSPESKPGTQYDTTDLRPATINDGTDTWELVAELNNTVGDNENGAVEAGTTKVVNYYYKKVENPTPVTPKTGNVVINYVDTEGNTLKSTVKDTTDGAVDSAYDTKQDDTEYPTYITKEVDGVVKTYKRVEAGDYTVGTVGTSGELTVDNPADATVHGTDTPTGTVEEGTKTVTYVYEEVKAPEAPKTGNVVITYVDTNGKELKTEVKDTTNGEVNTPYNTKEGNTEYPTYITTEDGKTYKRVPAGDYPVGTTTEDGHLTTSDTPTGTVEEGTKTVTYVYEEVVAPTPDPVGSVVVRYHIVDKDGNVVKENAQTEVKDTVDAKADTAYNTTDYKPATIVVGGKTYDLVTEETSKHAATDGAAEEGTVVANETKVVNYYYVERQPETPETPKTGNVVITYVDTEGNVLKSSVKDTTNGAVDSTYDTKEDDTEYPAELVKDGKVYKRVPAGTYTVGTTTEDGHLTTSDAPAGTVEEGTKTVTYVYEEVKPTTPETPETPKTGNVVITYVDTEGNVLKSSVKDTTNGVVDSTYDTKEDDTEYPAELVKDGKVYKRVPAGTYTVGTTTEDGHLTTSDAPAGTVEEGTKTVTYVYEEVKPTTPETPETPKTGNVVITYVDTEGNVLKSSVKDTTNGAVDSTYDTKEDDTEYPAELVKDGKVYKRVPAGTYTVGTTTEDGHLTTSDTPTGTVEEGTKTVTYVYEEVKAPEAPKTGNVVITYVDTNGKELKTEVKDTTNGEVNTPYNTKEGNTEYPTYITTEDGKTYKRVPAGDYPVGKTTEDGHLTTSDTPTGTVEEGTKTVTYVYEEVVAPTPDPVGSVVVRYHIVDKDGNVVKENAQTEVKDTVDAKADTAYNTTDYKPATIVVGGKTYDLVTEETSKHAATDGDAEEGTVVANETKVVNYYYVERQPETPETPTTGNVVITYVDTEGNVLKSSVKDTTNGAVDSTYDTKEDDTEYPAELVKDGKVYKRVPAGTYTVGTTTEDGHLTTSDAPAGTVEEDTKTVTYVYEEVVAPTPDPVGSVVVRYHIVDKDGNVVQENAQTEVKDTVDAKADTAYNTTDYKPATIVVGGKTYDLVTEETSKHAATDGAAEEGTVVANETKVVNYYYVERQPETPVTPEEPKTGNVVITYVDTNGNELKTEVKDTTNGEVGKTYDTKEGNTEYPTYITTEDGKTYKRVPAGDYPVGTTTEDGHLTTSDTPTGTVEEGTKTVTYVYEEVVAPTPDPVGSVVVRYHIVDKDGNVVQENAQTEVKDTVDAKADTAYNTTDYKPATIVVGGKTYDLVTEETSKHAATDGAAEEGTVVANETKVVNYYYVERQPETPVTPEEPKTGNVVITYVDTNGKELKTEVKDTTNGEVNTPYNTKEGNTEYPTYITTEDGKTYKRVPAGDYPVGTTTEDGHLTTSDTPTGTVEEGTKTVTYVYEEVVAPTPDPVGSVVVRYHIVDKDGNVVKENAQTEVKDTVDAKADTAYNTTDYKPATIVVGGKTYDLVTEETSKHAATDGAAEEGTVVANETKVVNYYYVERQPETPVTPEEPKTGNVVITYVDTEGNVLKSSVKDTTNGAVDSTYDTKEDDTEYPAELVKDGKVYKRVPAGTYTVGTTTEDGHLTTSDAPAGTVEEGTKTVTYVYEEVKPTTPETPETPKTGNVVITYIDTEGNVLKSSVKDTTNGAVDSTYDTKEDDTEYPAELVKDGKVYKRVPAGTYTVGTTTEDGHLTTSDAPAGTVEEGTKTVTYVYEEVKPTTPETPETPKTGNVVITYVDTEGNVLKSSVKDTTNGAVDSTYDTKEDDTEYPAELVKDGKVYKRVPAGTYTVGTTTEDGHLTTSDAPAGTVEAGTKTVTYVYEEVKPTTPETPAVKTGEVVARYVIEGTETELKAPSTVKESTTPVDEPYGDTPPATIEKDGKVYELVRTRTNDGDAPSNGTVVEGKQTITYEYKVKETPAVKTGEVVARYVIDGTETELKAPSTVKASTTPVDEPYGDTPPAIIEKDGKVYELVRTRTNEGDAPSNGTVVEGKQTITYEYKVKETPVVKTGEVVARYVIEGTETELKDPSIVKGSTTPVDESYGDTPPATIVKDGKVYELVRTRTNEGDASSNGTVVEGKQTITYEYKLKDDSKQTTPVTPTEPSTPTTEEPTRPVVSTPTPVQPARPVEPVVSDSMTTVTPAQSTLPNTGDHSSVAASIGSGLLLIAAGLVTRRRKED